MKLMMHTRPSTQTLLLLLGAFVIACLCLWMRMDGPYIVGKYLFGEDSGIFINQANALGVKAIFHTYAGYLHLYPRLWAGLANFFGLIATANILMIGWLVAASIMVTTLTLQAHERGLKPFYILFLIVAIFLQPTALYGFYSFFNNEVFFSITYSHFILGVALVVYLFSQLYRKPTLLELFIIAIISLTGPFSTIILPLLALRAFIQKDLKRYFSLYAVVFTGGIIQAIVILCSGRATQRPTDYNVVHWINAILPFPAFGSSTWLGYLAAAFFWVLFLSALFLFFKKKKDAAEQENFKVALFFFAAALFFILSALVISHGSLSYVSNSTRYHFVPFSLLFFSALLLCQPFKALRWLIIFTIAALCFINFAPIQRTTVYYPSFVNFSQYRDVSVLINPVTPRLTWFIERENQTHLPAYQALSGESIAMQQFKAQGIHTQLTHGALNFISTTGDGTLTLQTPIQCKNAKDVGVEITMNRKNQGRITLLWSDSKDFKTHLFLKVFYPAGEITPQFAFPNPKTEMYFRLIPAESENAGQIQSFTVYCLP